MANSFHISMALEVAAVQAVVDAIRATDVVNIRTDVADVNAIAAAIRATDVPGLSAEILDILTEKEKAFLGCNPQTSLHDDFRGIGINTVPDPAIWTVVEDGGATVRNYAHYDNPMVKSITTLATEDAVMHTGAKKYFSQFSTRGENILRFKTAACFSNLEGEGAFGFFGTAYADPTADVVDVIARKMCAIHCDNDVIRFITSDGVALETTDISAYMTEGSIQTFEIEYTVTEAKLWINSVLRATHNIRVSTDGKGVFFAAKHTNGIATETKVQWVDVWNTAA